MNINEFKKELVTWELVLVDFYAMWCRPCLNLMPTIEKIKKEGVVKVIKVNVDDSNDVAQFYNVQSIPTLMFFLEGKEVLTIVGGTTEENIRSAIEKLLPKNYEGPIDAFTMKMQLKTLDMVD